MSKQIDGDFILLTKNEYVVNLLAMGIVMETLAKKSGMPLEQCVQDIGQKAGEQYKQMSEEQIQQMINSHVRP